MKDKKRFFANLGFSLTEVKAILFLSFLFLISFLSYYFLKPNYDKKAFDYKTTDSLFIKKQSNKKPKNTTKHRIVKQDSVRINLLNASKAELTLIKGISEDKAIQIINLRKQGKLNSTIDLVKEGIISRKTYEKIRYNIYLE